MFEPVFVYRPACVFHRRQDAKPSIASSLIFFHSSRWGHVTGHLPSPRLSSVSLSRIWGGEGQAKNRKSPFWENRGLGERGLALRTLTRRSFSLLAGALVSVGPLSPFPWGVPPSLTQTLAEVTISKSPPSLVHTNH